MIESRSVDRAAATSPTTHVSPWKKRSELRNARCMRSAPAAVNAPRTVGVAAGSLFVFKGALRAVLINYPQPDVKERLIAAARGGL